MAVRPARIEAATRILVVDDDPETARLLRTWFRGQPYDILEARDGDEGLKVAAREQPDLILLDLMMPVLDGHGVARGLKRNLSTKSIPVILLSASNSVEDKVEAFAAGADDYVVKPFAFEEVDARIRAMLRKRELYMTLESTARELKASNEQLEELLVIDEKTGLSNFRHFQRRLAEEWLRAQRYGMPLSLVMFDLDNFKRLNDTLGHPAGDRALREFATLVAGGARGTDIAARYGGEEFAMILPHTAGSMAARVAERIRAAVREYVFVPDDGPARLTVSAGVATYPSHLDVESADALVRAADRALYRAKELGKDRVVVDSGPAVSTN
ncbi:MAG: diguanylate cyclase [Acidobacteriia bacterium]|nr:diguanylate cyclase [Terriglobia bacterium]